MRHLRSPSRRAGPVSLLTARWVVSADGLSPSGAARRG